MKRRKNDNVFRLSWIIIQELPGSPDSFVQDNSDRGAHSSREAVQGLRCIWALAKRHSNYLEALYSKQITRAVKRSQSVLSSLQFKRLKHVSI